MLKVDIGKSKQGRGGLLTDEKECTKLIVNSINYESDFFARSKDLNDDAGQIAKATDKIDQMLGAVISGMDSLTAAQKELGIKAKSASSSVRESAEKLSAGLLRIEKSANFDRLERYVDLLERAAKAMTALGELEKTGKLEKIASAIR